MKTCRILLSVAALSLSLSTLEAQTLAKWTFETSPPADLANTATISGILADVGTGTASGVHASVGADWTTPVGNGSANSLSVNEWAVGDRFQFSLGTVGYSGIGVTFDQTSSATGPRDFGIEYSTDGSTFTAFSSYSVSANAAPNPVWNATTASSLYSYSFDFSAITALNNAPNVFFRLVNVSTASANGGTVAASGTSRIDNFTVSVVPEPTSATLLGLGLAALLIRRRN